MKKILLLVSCFGAINLPGMTERNLENTSISKAQINCNYEDYDNEKITVSVNYNKMITKFRVYQNEKEVTDCFLLEKQIPQDKSVILKICNDGNIGECKFNPNDSIKLVFEYFDGLQEEVFISSK